jgi:hypothetical protein
MKSGSHLANLAFEGWQIKPILKAVLVYEDFTAGVRARWFCERFVRLLDVGLEEANWSFDALRIREIMKGAAGTARKADLVMLSVSGRNELPGTIERWLDMWVWLLDSEDPALVALFDASASRYTCSIRAYLGSVAREAGIDFFPHEIAASDLPQFLFPERSFDTPQLPKPRDSFRLEKSSFGIQKRRAFPGRSSLSSLSTARSLAQRLGDSQVAGTLQLTLNEEAEADEKLTSIAESQVNISAASGQRR